MVPSVLFVAPVLLDLHSVDTVPATVVGVVIAAFAVALVLAAARRRDAD